MEATTWANVIASSALAGTIAGFLVNRASANNAGAVAERAAAAQERVAKLLEEQAADRARAQPAPSPAWRLSHHSGDMYQLENVGSAPAFDVVVKVAEGVFFRPPEEDPVAEMKPDSAITFMAGLTSASVDDRVTVEWANAAGSEYREDWARSLPPRPPR